MRHAILPIVLFLPVFCGPAAASAAPVDHVPATINGYAVTLWTWLDSHGLPRTVALKKEGHGNPGHGGYAVRMTYYGQAAPDAPYHMVTVNAEKIGDIDSNPDGGFGYFVSHERYRLFQDGKQDTIANRIFHTDDSPYGRKFAAVITQPASPLGVGIEQATIQYGHYGTIVPHPVDPSTGLEITPLPVTASAFKFYPLPVTTSWVFQTGTDYPRLHIAVDMSHIIPPGGAKPTADLVSFDVRGPYGVMKYDDSVDGPVDTALWGDQQYLFTTLANPARRSSPWDWSQPNDGGRFNAQVANGFEMGFYEPRPVSMSHLADGYAAERGFTSTTYAEAGGVSRDSCPTDDAQTLPTDATWPYQSIQYSLPCPASVNQPAYLKKIAWGSSLYYGTSLTAVYNGRESFPINAFPAAGVLKYNVCLVLGYETEGTSLTAAAAADYTAAHPAPDIPNCATAAL